jgi:hypothetical protein
MIKRLHDEALKALASPEVQARLVNLGAESFTMEPAAFNAYIKTEMDAAAVIAKGANLKAQCSPRCRMTTRCSPSGGTSPARPGQAASTSTPAPCRPPASAQVAACLADARRAYVRIALSGNNKMAEAAQLTLLASGDRAAYERVSPLLDLLGPPSSGWARASRPVR